MGSHDYFGADDYQDYADSFAYQRELEMEERDHQEQERQDRLNRDQPTRLSYDQLVDLFMCRGYDKSEAEQMARAQLERQAKPVQREYRCADPEGAYEQMIRETAA